MSSGDIKSRGGWRAYLTVARRVETDPEGALEFILRVLARARSDLELAYLGAGALEEFLQLHGLEFVAWVEGVWKREEKVVTLQPIVRGSMCFRGWG